MNSHHDRETIPLWTDGAPGSEGWTQPEEETFVRGREPGDEIRVARNVTQPTLTMYPADPKAANGTALIVCPGGAYHFLAIDLEGCSVARWLNKKGITAFVLRYRLIQTGDDFPEVVSARIEDGEAMERVMGPLWPLILADGQQAVRQVRKRAAEWNVSPNKIGMIGFSAGGSVTVNVLLEHDDSSRPDFAAAIYSAGFSRAAVPEDAPPLFILCADDDDMASPLSIELYSGWRAAKRPVELHIFSRGGHGFGLKKQELPSDAWIERFYEWLGTEGFC